MILLNQKHRLFLAIGHIGAQWKANVVETRDFLFQLHQSGLNNKITLGEKA